MVSFGHIYLDLGMPFVDSFSIGGWGRWGGQGGNGQKIGEIIFFGDVTGVEGAGARTHSCVISERKGDVGTDGPVARAAAIGVSAAGSWPVGKFRSTTGWKRCGRIFSG